MMKSENTWNVIVVGAGPAGLLAATRAASRGRRVLLLERNRRPGTKILISGGGRCNLTHDCAAPEIAAAFGPKGRFLRSALASLGPSDLIALFHAEGVPVKIEPGGKVFPASDRAEDVCSALVRILEDSGACSSFGESVVGIERSDTGFVVVTDRRSLETEKLVLAVGGQSYPGCGTRGDGFGWAAVLGHRVIAPQPALVPITTAAAWVSELQGITIEDCMVRVVEMKARRASGAADVSPQDLRGALCLAEARGSLLFAHFGLSGPAALDVSRAVSGHGDRWRLALTCDFLPDWTLERVDVELGRKMKDGAKKTMASLLDGWVPRRLAETIVARASAPLDRRAADCSKTERRAIGTLIKQLAIPITGTLGFEKAEVTAGGVSLDEVDSRTMESKIVPGLFIVGELLDLDGPIGGYNLQAAFSTGWHCGNSV